MIKSIDLKMFENHQKYAKILKGGSFNPTTELSAWFEARTGPNTQSRVNASILAFSKPATALGSSPSADGSSITSMATSIRLNGQGR